MGGKRARARAPPASGQRSRDVAASCEAERSDLKPDRVADDPEYPKTLGAGRIMKHYRAFQIDPAGHVFGCINLVCKSDDEAKRQAAALVLLHRIELWRLDRRIGLFDATSDGARDPAAGHMT
jgi:hypothetical protein